MERYHPLSAQWTLWWKTTESLLWKWSVSREWTSIRSEDQNSNLAEKSSMLKVCTCFQGLWTPMRTLAAVLKALQQSMCTNYGWAMALPPFATQVRAMASIGYWTRKKKATKTKLRLQEYKLTLGLEAI